MKNTLQICGLLMLMLMSSCSKSSVVTEEDLIGRWEVFIDMIDAEPGREGHIEYYDDGTWRRLLPKGNTINGLNSWTGHWDIRDDGTLEFKVDFNGEGEVTNIYKIEFLGEDIVISDKNRGLRERLVRQ
nr:putative integron gene cassette protein [uncultured bacterium]